MAISQLLTIYMPIFKLGASSFLIGAETKQIMVRGSNCMVRVGGGFVSMQEYYKKYATKQCVSFFHLLSQKKVDTFKNALIMLLRKQQVKEEKIQQHLN